MKTFALLSGLVLLSALLAITSAAEENTVSAFDATTAVPEDASAMGGSRRFLTHAKAPGPTCMEEFKKASKECERDHKCATDDCTSKTERCLAKAYKRFKDCKFPPPPPPTCKELCKMLYDRCKEFNRGSCGGKYNNCIQNNCD